MPFDTQLLSNFPVFSDASPDDLAQIAGVGEIQNWKANDQIFRMDDAAEYLYGVLDGEVILTLTFRDKKLSANIEYEEALVTRTEETEKEIGIDTIGPGEVFGWSAFVREGQWTSSAFSMSDTRLLVIPAKPLKEMFENRPVLGYRLLGKLYEIVSLRLKNRTAKLIEAWGEAFDVNDSER